MPFFRRAQAEVRADGERSTLASLPSMVARLRREDRGSVAIIFGFSFIPMLLVIGMGMDYARAVTERTALQSGVDAASLAGIQAIRRGETVTQATPRITRIVTANDANPNVSVKTPTLSPDGTTLCVSAVSSVPTTIMAITRVMTIPVGVNACSSMNLNTYEIALAMDNSGSMKNSAQSSNKNKMQYAQQAAIGMINALAPNPATGFAGVQASYGVVPFTSSVNVGPSNLANQAPWLDLNGQSSIHWKSFTTPAGKVKGWTKPNSLFDMLSTMGVSWGGCVEERPAPYTTSDTAPSSNNPDTLFAPFFSPDETDNGKFLKLTFNNYTDDYSGICKPGDAFDVADQKGGRGDGQTKLCKYTSPLASTNNNYYVTGQDASPNAGCVSKPLTSLTANQSNVTAAINAMSPNGDTGLAPGFLWAWRTISPNGPFATTGSSSFSSGGPQRPKPYGYVDPSTTAVNHKVIILLTDGMNDWYGQDLPSGPNPYTQYDPNKMVYNAFGYPQEGRLTNGDPSQTTTANARTLLDQTTLAACNAAKATVDSSGNPAPVEIFTVGLLATDGIDAQGQKLLSDCATDSGHAFLATNGDDLVAKFQEIATLITQPRINQ